MRSSTSARRLREQRHKRSQVASFGPSDVPDRVVKSPFFVLAVVAAGAVGSGEAKVEFFVVVGAPRQTHADIADHDDTSAIAREGASKPDSGRPSRSLR